MQKPLPISALLTQGKQRRSARRSAYAKTSWFLYGGAALYLRVSTGEQTVENQRKALADVAAQRGWTVVGMYADEGISGSKGRDKRPGFDSMLKDATRGQFDVLMAWSVDRLGRSLLDLVSGLQELHAAKVDLFLHQQALDTTTPAGKAMFGMMGVFAEFERSMIVARVNAGMARAKASGTKSGKAIGRPRITSKVEQRIRDELATGKGILKVASLVGVGSGTVQRVREMDAR
jgi:DNA invertase Pin-like site-specific DNA recombinase